MTKPKFITEAAKARKARGLSQIDAAPRLGVTDRTLCKYECGETHTPPDVALQMAREYNDPALRTLYCQTVCPIGGCEPRIDATANVSDSLLDALLFDTDLMEQAMRRIHSILSDGVISDHEADDYAESRRTLALRYAQIGELLLSTERAQARCAG